MKQKLTTIKGEKGIKARALIESLLEGASITKACEVVGLDRGTFYRWRHKSPIFNTAVINAKASRIEKVEDALYKSALAGNVTAQIFFLTNRASSDWADKRALVNNTFNAYNKGSNGTFTGEDRELQERIKSDFLRFMP